jgi:hypothetical protein
MVESEYSAMAFKKFDHMDRFTGNNAIRAMKFLQYIMKD